LDALDDPLHGSYGALAGHAATTVVWRDIAHSREALAARPRALGCGPNSIRTAGSTVRSSGLS